MYLHICKSPLIILLFLGYKAISVAGGKVLSDIIVHICILFYSLRIYRESLSRQFKESSTLNDLPYSHLWLILLAPSTYNMKQLHQGRLVCTGQNHVYIYIYIYIYLYLYIICLQRDGPDKSYDEASSGCPMMWLNVAGALVTDIPLWS